MIIDWYEYERCLACFMSWACRSRRTGEIMNRPHVGRVRRVGR